MMRLNGTTYLTYTEMSVIVNKQVAKFSTSQHAILPRDVSYVDAEFIGCIKEKEKDILLGIAFLYKDEEYVTVSVLVGLMVSYLYDVAYTSDELRFLNKSLTSLQVDNHRKKYEKYLLNVLVDEILDSIRNK
jgi:hypothetical protein